MEKAVWLREGFHRGADPGRGVPGDPGGEAPELLQDGRPFRATTCFAFFLTKSAKSLSPPGRAARGLAPETPSSRITSATSS